MLDDEEKRNVTDWTAACILGPSKMTVCTRVGGSADTFTVLEQHTGLVNADTDDFVGLDGLFVSSLLRSSGSQF